MISRLAALFVPLLLTGAWFVVAPWTVASPARAETRPLTAAVGDGRAAPLWRAHVIGSDDRRPLSPAETRRYGRAVISIFPDLESARSTSAFFLHDCQTLVTVAHTFFQRGRPLTLDGVYLTLVEHGSILGEIYQPLRRAAPSLTDVPADLPRADADPPEGGALLLLGAPYPRSIGRRRAGEPYAIEQDFAILRLSAPFPFCDPARDPIRLRAMPTEMAADCALRLKSVAFHFDSVAETDFGALDYAAPQLRIDDQCRAVRLHPRVRSDLVRLGVGEIDAVFGHQCDTMEMSSGSPLVCELDGEPHLFGVSVAELFGAGDPADFPNIGVYALSCDVSPFARALDAAHPEVGLCADAATAD